MAATVRTATGAPAWDRPQVDVEAGRLEAPEAPRGLVHYLGRPLERVVRPVDALTRYANKRGFALEASYEETQGGWRCHYEVAALGLTGEGEGANKAKARLGAARVVLGAWLALEAEA